MSQENVEIVRRTYQAWESSDFETVFELVDEGLVCHRAPPLPAGIYHGHEGLLEVASEWTEDFEEWSMEPEELLDFGDVVLARIHQRALGAASGAEIESDYWFVHTLRDGKITRLAMYTTEAAAREAAGLPS